MEASDALSMELSTSVKVRVSSTMSLVELREKYPRDSIRQVQFTNVMETLDHS